MFLRDPSHRVWNDSQLALEDIKMWGHALMLQLSINVDHGPWRAGRWFRELQESVASYTQITTPQACPLFSTTLPDILADSGDLDDIGNLAVAQRVFDSLPGIIRTMTQKIGMSRWFGLVDSTADFLGRWPRRLVVQVFLCIKVGLFSQDGTMGLASKATLCNSRGSMPPGVDSNASPSSRKRGCLPALNQVYLVQALVESTRLVALVLRGLIINHTCFHRAFWSCFLVARQCPVD